MKTIIRLPITTLLACTITAAKRDVRSYLTGVYINKTCAVSTDGCRLTKVLHHEKVPEYESLRFVIPRPAIKQLAKAIPVKFRKLGTTAEILQDGDKWFIQALDTVVAFTPAARAYPDYNRVIPDPEKQSGTMKNAGFDWSYMADFEKVARKLGGKGFLQLIPNDRSAALVVDKTLPDVTMVIMPKRI